MHGKKRSQLAIQVVWVRLSGSKPALDRAEHWGYTGVLFLALRAAARSIDRIFGAPHKEPMDSTALRRLPCLFRVVVSSRGKQICIKVGNWSPTTWSCPFQGSFARVQLLWRSQGFGSDNTEPSSKDVLCPSLRDITRVARLFFGFGPPKGVVFFLASVEIPPKKGYQRHKNTPT